MAFDTHIAFGEESTWKLLTSSTPLTAWRAAGTPYDAKFIQAILRSGSTVVLGLNNPATGSPPLVYSLDNGATWSGATSPLKRVGAGTSVNGGAVGNGRFVSGGELNDGSFTNALVTAPVSNPSTWTAVQTIGGFTMRWVDGIFFLDDRFFALVSGSSGSATVSSFDGLTWTLTEFPPTASPISIATNGTKWVGVANQHFATSKSWVSTNRGASWTFQPVTIPANFNRISYANGMWVLGGSHQDTASSGAKVLYWSADGVTFSAATTDPFAVTGSAQQANVYTVMHDGSRWWATGRRQTSNPLRPSATLASSLDGKSWTAAVNYFANADGGKGILFLGAAGGPPAPAWVIGSIAMRS